MADQYFMHFDVRGDLLESARQCEAEVFHRWFGNTRAELDDEYGPYEADSIFLVLADAADEVVAAVRLIAPGPSGFKTLDDVARPPWQVDGARSAAAAGLDLATTWEVGTLCIRAGVAGSGRLSLALYHGLMTVAEVNGMSAFIAILDERVRRLLSSVGITTRALPGVRTAPYLGSGQSTPVYSPVRGHARRPAAQPARRLPAGHPRASAWTASSSRTASCSAAGTASWCSTWRGALDTSVDSPDDELARLLEG